MQACVGLDMLPEGCVSKILSLTSPPDVCRSSLISSTFRSAAESDSVWERFLPSDHAQVVSKASMPNTHQHFSSKKELYLLLCDPILIENGRQSFRLERFTGRKCYFLSARDLSITWNDESMHWSWKSNPESRFPEVAELITTNWLEIHGKFQTKLLTPNTLYGAYLVIKISSRAYGLDLIPSEVSVEVGNQVVTNTAYLGCHDTKKKQMESLLYNNRMQMVKSMVVEGDGQLPVRRSDGWMEIELGEFFNGEGDEEVKMSLMEVKGYQLKGGLVVEGIEVRPKSL